MPTAPSRITIQLEGLDLTVPQPYAEGHPCTAAEATVLNAAYTEHVRRNFGKRLRDASGTATEDIGGEATQAALDAYCAEYSLSARPSVDPIDRAAHRIASDMVRAALNQRGMKPGDLVDGLFEQHVAKVAAKPSVREEAARRVAATKDIVAQSLDLDAL